MTTHETLRCECGGEVGIVRLNPETLLLGHKRNPRNNRHPVRLARAAAVSTTREEVDRPQLEVPSIREAARGIFRERTAISLRSPSRSASKGEPDAVAVPSLATPGSPVGAQRARVARGG